MHTTFYANVINFTVWCKSVSQLLNSQGEDGGNTNVITHAKHSFDKKMSLCTKYSPPGLAPTPHCCKLSSPCASPSPSIYHAITLLVQYTLYTTNIH